MHGKMYGGFFQLQIQSQLELSPLCHLRSFCILKTSMHFNIRYFKCLCYILDFEISHFTLLDSQRAKARSHSGEKSLLGDHSVA